MLEIREEKIKTIFGESIVYNVYFKNSNVLDSTFNIKEKAEKYVNIMNY